MAVVRAAPEYVNADVGGAHYDGWVDPLRDPPVDIPEPYRAAVMFASSVLMTVVVSETSWAAS